MKYLSFCAYIGDQNTSKKQSKLSANSFTVNVIIMGLLILFAYVIYKLFQANSFHNFICVLYP